jgi:hypothetical protein
LTVGAWRYVALALLAPLFGMPAAVLTSPAPASAASGAHLASTADRGPTDRAVPRALLAQRADVHHSGAAKVSAPARVRLLAARLYWGDRHPSYPSADRLHRDLEQTAGYFARVSRGRQHVRATLTPWVHVDVSGDVMCNTEGRSIRAASTALRRAGYHPARFNRLMIFTEQCNSASSAAQLPGRVTWIRYRAPGMATLVHELGHNMGLEHAYGVVCREDGRRVALGGACQPVEYGDSWDAMGHSRGFFSAPSLVRLGWAGKVQHVRRSGAYRLADVEHAHTANQALRVRAGDTTYWVEYQPEHSPEIGRTIPGVMIRRQVKGGPVEMIDASPGNPTGIAYPDRDLTNSALPVGSSLTTPENIRFTTISEGRHATVRVTFDQPAAVPDAPVVVAARLVGDGFRVHWTAPTDNGQIVLGYRVTAWPSGATTFVRSPGGYRTSARFPLAKDATEPPSFTVAALNQDGWSAGSAAVSGTVYGPEVTLTSPASGSKVSRSFSVSVEATADGQTGAPPASAWAEVGSVSCSSVAGAGPYTLHCADPDHVLHGRQPLTVHVRNEYGITTDVTVAVKLHGH